MKSTVKNSMKIYGISNHLPKHPYIFKKVCIDRNLILPNEKPKIADIVECTINISNTRKKIIETSKITSLEGQKLTGMAVIIEGEFKQQLKYAADVPTQVIHGIEFHVPYCTFIILPEDYNPDTPITIKTYIEDLSFSLIDQKSIFESIMILIEITFHH